MTEAVISVAPEVLTSATFRPLEITVSQVFGQYLMRRLL